MICDGCSFVVKKPTKQERTLKRCRACIREAGGEVANKVRTMSPLVVNVSVSGGVLDWNRPPKGVVLRVTEHDNGVLFEVPHRGPLKQILTWEPKR
jgi:hypothetical protein